MSKDTEITRTIQIDEKIIHITICLTEDEIRRLIAPVVSKELARQYRTHVGSRNSSMPGNQTLHISPHTGLPFDPELINWRSKP